MFNSSGDAITRSHSLPCSRTGYYSPQPPSNQLSTLSSSFERWHSGYSTPPTDQTFEKAADFSKAKFQQFRNSLFFTLKNDFSEAAGYIGENSPKSQEEAQDFIQKLASILGENRHVLLFCAVQQNHLDQIPLLLTAGGISVDATDADGNTALLIAVHEKADSAAKALLAHGASPLTPNRRGMTPDTYARMLQFTLVEDFQKANGDCKESQGSLPRGLPALFMRENESPGSESEESSPGRLFPLSEDNLTGQSPPQ